MQPKATDTPLTLTIMLFGGLSLRQGDRPLACLPPQQTSALLAYLALNLNRTHTREELLAHFWPESEPEKARQNLRQCLHSLRELLEQPPFAPQTILLTTRSSVQLAAEVVRTDVAEFEQLLAAAKRAETPSERIRLLSQASELYRGDLLPGFYQDVFVLEQHRLAEKHLQTLQQLTQELEAQGELEQALHVAHRVALLDPLSEEAACILMRLYAAQRQPSAVLRQYQELEARLIKEFGEPPQEATRLLAKQLQQAAQQPAAIHPGSTLPMAVQTENARVSEADAPPSLLTAAETVSQPSPAPLSSPVLQRGRIPALVAGLTLLLGLFTWASRPRPPALSHIQDVRMPASAEKHISPDTALPDGILAPLPPPHTQVPASARLSDKPSKPVLRMAIPNASLSKSGGDTKKSPNIAQETRPRVVSSSADVSAEEELWTARYDKKPGDKDSEPRALVTDVAGNVFVTGFIRTLKNDVDYLTIKYSPKGQKLWEQRYNGSGNDVDRAYSLALDGAGNVYVTGESDSGKGSGPERLRQLDIVTIKYSPGGKPLWVRRYDGPVNGRDSGWKVAVDGAGNAYVFGVSWGGKAIKDRFEYDYVLLKYDTNGRQQWAKRIEGPGFEQPVPQIMALDRVGNPVIVGYTFDPEIGGRDMTIIKFNALGNSLWTRHFPGAKQGSGSVSCLALDETDSVYVSGYVLTSSTPAGSDFLTLKYDTNGTLLWQRRYDWEGKNNRPFAMVTEPHGGICIVGEVEEARGYSYGIVKYLGDGTWRWSALYHGSARMDSAARHVAITREGDFYVTGHAAYENPNARDSAHTRGDEFATLKYNNEGRVRRLLRYSGTDIRDNIGLFVAVDRADNILVAGQSFGGQTNDLVVIKYRP